LSHSEETDRAIQHAIRVKQIQIHIRKQVERIKREAFAAREEIIQKRTRQIAQVREKLNQISLSIQNKHEIIKTKLNQDAVFRETNIRVNRGLEALEHFIYILRDSQLEEEMLKKAIRDPIVSGSVRSEATKVITSEFFKSIQKQLVMQTEFINIAAHELRTPIMPILVNVEMLEEELGDKNEELKIISRNAKRLQQLTENILSVTRLESKSLNLNTELFDINSIISNIIKDERVHIGKDVKILHKTNDKTIYVKADKDRIAQVIYNLINNAIKFTEEGQIMIISEKNTKDHVIVRVRDNGAGIDPQIFPLLFSKFATKSDKGTGLGLYICKGIIEGHGGKIWGENNEPEGKGATFSFSLPAIIENIPQ
jgi:signal transduction histidine kinase